GAVELHPREPAHIDIIVDFGAQTPLHASPTLLIRAHDFFRRFFAGRMGWGGTRTRTRYFQAPIRADAKWTVHGTEEGEGLCPCAHGYEMRDAAGGPPWVRSKAVPVRLHQRRV